MQSFKLFSLPEPEVVEVMETDSWLNKRVLIGKGASCAPHHIGKEGVITLDPKYARGKVTVRVEHSIAGAASFLYIDKADLTIV